MRCGTAAGNSMATSGLVLLYSHCVLTVAKRFPDFWYTAAVLRPDSLVTCTSTVAYSLYGLTRYGGFVEAAQFNNMHVNRSLQSLGSSMYHGVIATVQFNDMQAVDS